MLVGKKRKRVVSVNHPSRKTISRDTIHQKSILFQPSVYHALIVIFLEFFSWGLLTNTVVKILSDTFPGQQFLMNGLIQGVKGILSFLSAPMIGALSDVWGRKPFLFLTVTFTCAPIPLLAISPWWYFAMISISGIFSVTFSVVFAYVADVTSDEDRSAAYGLVSATFAASLVTSPALGAYLGDIYNENLVIALATAIALLDIAFVLVVVPESLPVKIRPTNWGSQISWEKADPFGALRKIGKDYFFLMLCLTVFLSYLPEAGEYSCFFVYLKLALKFSKELVASFIAFIGVLSVIAQTFLLSLLMRYMGAKCTIIFGLVFEMTQLTIYGFGSEQWLMWIAGAIAAISSITYPAISAFVSSHTEPERQGVAQGVITGIRGLCNGLGPALYGIVFYLFHVDLNDHNGDMNPGGRPQFTNDNTTSRQPSVNFDNSIRYYLSPKIMPGPPFAFGAILVLLAILVAIFIPNGYSQDPNTKSPMRRQSPNTLDHFQRDTGVRIAEKEPLMDEVEHNV